MTKKLLTSLLVASVSLIPANIVLACDVLQNATGQSACVIMPFSGQAGAWFPLGKADELTIAYELVPNLRMQLTAYDELVGNYKKQASNYAFVAEARGQTIDSLQKALDKETKRANDAELRANPWYTSPILWGIVGLAVGVAFAEVLHR